MVFKILSNISFIKSIIIVVSVAREFTNVVLSEEVNHPPKSIFFSDRIYNSSLTKLLNQVPEEGVHINKIRIGEGFLVYFILLLI
jgi:hypothetical protein